MKKIQILLIFITFSFSNLLAQDFTNNIKGEAAYMFRSFNQNYIHLFGGGASYEKILPSSWSVNFGISFNVRVDDRINDPVKYTDIVYLAFSTRRYFTAPGNGIYAGLGAALGIPAALATAGDFFGVLGYQLIDGNLIFDINVKGGYGALRETSSFGDYYETWWGYYLRPTVGVGYAF